MSNGQLEILLLDLALILTLAPLAGWMARRLGQPAVIGEIILGIVLGPTLLHGELTRILFPVSGRSFLTAVSNVGLVVFMFIVGMEVDRRRLRGIGRITLGTAAGATVLPLGLGLLLGWYLTGQEHPVHRLGFILFTGVALSVTAFPVLARIIADLEMSRTVLGGTALSIAAVCDVAAWTMLAVVQGMVSGAAYWQVLLVIPFAALTLTLGRRLLRSLLDRGDGMQLSAGQLAVVLVGLLVSAAVTQILGLHVVFGAFLFGLAMPGEELARLRGEIIKRMQFPLLVLMPVYFVVAGFSVNLSTVGASGLVEFLLLLGVAVAGKFGGAFLGARTQGVPVRQSALLATMMNTRGLTELIALTIGLKMGVIDGRLYSLMVAMAVLTTAMTGPLMRVISRREADENGRELWQTIKIPGQFISPAVADASSSSSSS